MLKTVFSLFKNNQDEKEVQKSKLDNHSKVIYISVTEIAKHYDMSAPEINNILIALKWAYKSGKWRIPTEIGIYNGAKEFYDVKNRVKYIKWNKDILNNNEFLEAINKYKIYKNLSRKAKGELYEQFVAKHYQNLGYTIIEHYKNKSRLDNSIDLIAKKEKQILFIQCKNWNKNSKYKIDHKEIKASQTEIREFVQKNQMFIGYNLKIRYVLSDDFIDTSAIKYIREHSQIIDYEIINYPII
jgi:Holliday junction resolvase-like predicted endonuclease